MHKWQISCKCQLYHRESALLKKNMMSFWLSGHVYLEIRGVFSRWSRRTEFSFANRDSIAIKLPSSSWWPLIAKFCFPIITRTSVIHLKIILFLLTCSALWEWSSWKMLGAPPRCVCRNASPRATAVWSALFSQTCFFTSLEILDQSRVRKERSWVMNNKE